MEVVRGQRVCVVCWGDKGGGRLENATRMVMLDARGYPCDVLTLPQLSGLIPASPAHVESLREDDRKAEDAGAIVAFLEKWWPHLIVIGTTGVACWQLLADITKICDEEFPQVPCRCCMHAIAFAPRSATRTSRRGCARLLACDCTAACCCLLLLVACARLHGCGRRADALQRCRTSATRSCRR